MWYVASTLPKSEPDDVRAWNEATDSTEGVAIQVAAPAAVPPAQAKGAV